MTTTTGAVGKVPNRIMNSPTKLAVAGIPRDAATKNSVNPGRVGILPQSPPMMRMSRVWMRS